MTNLKSDELGFLVGKPIDLTDLHDDLVAIADELGDIKSVLGRDTKIAANSLDRLIDGLKSKYAASIGPRVQDDSTNNPSIGSNTKPETNNIQVHIGLDNLNKEKTDLSGLINRFDKLIGETPKPIAQSKQKGADKLSFVAQKQNINIEHTGLLEAEFNNSDADVKTNSQKRDNKQFGGDKGIIPSAVDKIAPSLAIKSENTDKLTVPKPAQIEISNKIEEASPREKNTPFVAEPEIKRSREKAQENLGVGQHSIDSKNQKIGIPNVASLKQKEFSANTPVKNQSSQSDSVTKNGASRDEKGRFIASNNQEKSKEESDSLGKKIGNAGKSIAGAIGGLVPQKDEADPSVQAMGEVTSVLSPVGRGLGKVFTGSNNGVSRGQDRWYRRFFKQNADKARTDDLANKREQRLLHNIEKKDMGDSSSSSGFIATLLLAFVGMLGTLLIKGFKAIAAPLRLLGVFFPALLKVLQLLAKVIGMKSLADRLGNRHDKIKDRQKDNKQKDSSKGGDAVVAGGKDSKKREDKTKETKAGAAGGFKSAAKGVFKKLPLVGALVSAGFLANDVKEIANTDDSKEEKTKKVGAAIGSTTGGIGGMAAGGVAGAAIGSAFPVVGTVAGGLIGALIGSMGGEKLGSVMGDKFGSWVNDLRASGFIDRMEYNWQVGTNAMGIMWRDFTGFAGNVWSGMVGGVQSGWNFAVNYSKLSWDKVSGAFGSTTDFLKASWGAALAILSGVLNSVWGSLGNMATAIADSVKAYTGLDLAKNFADLKNTVSGWVTGLKTTVSGVSSSLKSSLSDWASNLFGGYFGNVFGEAAGMVDNNNESVSTSKEQDANQTGVLNAFLKAGFSKNQAVALTAEVGRENSYNSKNLYGYHKDAANGAVNMGMISWQGDRAKRLQAYMQERGLIQNGKMVRSQAALDAQAEFVKQEINSGNYDRTKKLFEQKNLDPEAYAKTLGTDYVKWAYGQRTLKSGASFDWESHDNRRRKYKERAAAKTNVSIPYRAGYTPPIKAESKQAETAKTETVSNTNIDNVNNTVISTDGGQVDPNSIEGMLQTFNNFDAMTTIKEAVVTMLKDSADGKSVNMPHVRTTPAVPAVKVPSATGIAAEPKVSLPLLNPSDLASENSVDDVSRDVSDRRIAHIVTGGYSA